MAMHIVTAGLPQSAKDILIEAGDLIFGEGGTELLEIEDEILVARIRRATLERIDAIVVLSADKWDVCADAIGVHAGDGKLHRYINDSTLANYLNERFDLHLEVVSEDTDVVSEVPNVDVSDLEGTIAELTAKLKDKEGQLRDKDGLIRNLEMRIQEMQEELDMDASFGQQVQGNSEELEALRAEYESLKSEADELRGKLEEMQGTNGILSMRLDAEIADNGKLSDEIRSLKVTTANAEAELSEYKLKYSTQSGLLSDKDALISELKGQISIKGNLGELEDEISVVRKALAEKTEELEEANKLVDFYKGESGKVSSERDVLLGRCEGYEKQIADAQLSNADSQGRVDELQHKVSEYEDTVGELKVSLSTLSAENEDLRNQLEDVEDFESIKSELSEKEEAISGLESSLSSKDGLIDSLKSELSEARASVEEVKGMLDRSESEVRWLQGELAKKGEELLSIKGDTIAVKKGLEEELNSAKTELGETKARLDEAENSLAKSESRVRLLERSTNRDSDVEDLYQQLTDAQSKYESLKSGVFGSISDLAEPKSSLKVHLPGVGRVGYNNVRFVFSGSTESRKGTYKALLDEVSVLNGVDGRPTVIVDAVAETCIDYVFEVEKMVSGLDWFKNGGDFKRYLSSTAVSNVKVLTPGLGYINDAYFLTVDWGKRLKELDDSGFCVIVYLGDISSMVGRVLHECFAGLGDSRVYVHGNAIGSRTVVANMRGISNKGNSVIYYYEYAPKVEQFLNIMKKSNECVILSEV